MRRPLKALFVLIPALTVGLLALPTVAGAASAPRPPASFSFSGSGWGHGVGMSQYGAYGQALEGRTADQILRHYYTGARVAAFRDDVDIRVNLAYLKQKVRLRVESIGKGTPALVVSSGGKTVKATKRDVVEIAVKGKSLVVLLNGKLAAQGAGAVARWSGTRAPGGAGSAASVLNVVTGSTSFGSPGHRYRYGWLDIRALFSPSVGKTVLTANNVVRLHDEYVLGIGEMPSSWPAAALQAQAIASRGYGLVKYRYGLRYGCACNVYATTSDQVFVGWSKESGASGSRWAAAVKATNLSSTTSKTVLVAGKPAQTFFFSSSGGRTQNSEDVWVSKLSYLRSVDDHWSRNKRINPTNALWGPRIKTQREVATAFGLPNVARIDLSNRYASGAVRMAKAWTVQGTMATVSGPNLISRLSLSSRWFQVNGAKSFAGTSSNSTTAAPKAFRVTSAKTRLDIKAGTSARLTGSVSPVRLAAGSDVSLRRWEPRGKKWVSVSETRVNRDGRYSFTVSGASPALKTYNVYKSAAKCGVKCVVRSATSPNTRVNVVAKYRVLAAISAKVMSSKSSTSVRGQVRPSRFAAGSSVVVRRYDTAARRWIDEGTARVQSNGIFRTSVSSLPAGRHSLGVFKAKSGCVGSRCTMLSGWSPILGVTVQQPFTVSLAAVSSAPGSITVRGNLTPVAPAAGGRVTIERWSGGRWSYLGVAVLDSGGRYTRTFTKGTRTFATVPRGPVKVRVVKAAAGCTSQTCVHTLGISSSRTVTPS